MKFQTPEFLWLFILYVPLILWYIKKQRNAAPSLEMSSLQVFKGVRRSYKEVLLHGLFVLRLLSIGLIIICLWRPQTHERRKTGLTYRTAIVVLVVL